MNPPSDDDVHRYVQRLLQAKHTEAANREQVEVLKAIITDLWTLRERDRVAFEAQLKGELDTTAEAKALVRKMRDYGVQP